MDKELLFASRIGEADVEIPNVGTIRVRGLNRAETMAVGKMDDPAQKDLHIIAMGVVDPKLSVSEVRRWAEASPGGELEAVSRKIAELSGLLEGQAKETVKSFRDESGSGV